MVYCIFSFMVTAVDVWCTLYFLDTFLKRKEVGKLEKTRFIVYYGTMFMPAFICYLFEIVMNWGKFLSVFCVVWLLGLIFYKASIKQIFLYWSLGYGTIILTEWTVITVREIFMPATTLYGDELYYLLATIAKLLEILVVLLIRKIWKSPNESRTLVWKEWYMLICIPIFSIAGVMAMYRFYYYDATFRSVCLFLTLGLVVINFITIHLLQDILDKCEQLRVSTLANQKAKNQIEAYHDMDAVYECQRRRMHDYKNQVVTVQNLVKGGNIDQAMRLMEQLTESISVDLSVINTNHPVVNAVLNQKFHTAKKKRSHAKRTRKVNFPQNMPLPVYCSAETADRNTEESHGPEMAKRRLCGGAATD